MKIIFQKIKSICILTNNILEGLPPCQNFMFWNFLSLANLISGKRCLILIYICIFREPTAVTSIVTILTACPGKWRCSGRKKIEDKFFWAEGSEHILRKHPALADRIFFLCSYSCSSSSFFLNFLFCFFFFFFGEFPFYFLLLICRDML